MPGSKRLGNWIAESAAGPWVGPVACLAIRRCSPLVPRASIQSRASKVRYPPARPRRWRARRVSVRRAPVANNIAQSAYTARAATASIDRPGISAVQEPVRAAPHISDPARPAATRIAHTILNKTIIHGRIEGPLLLAHRASGARAMPPAKAVFGWSPHWRLLQMGAAHPPSCAGRIPKVGTLSSNRTFHTFGANI